VGIEANMPEALKWYKQAADGGDNRATKRLASSSRSKALDRRVEMEAMKESSSVAKDGKGDNCIIM
jgi:TPR repeat protein